MHETGIQSTGWLDTCTMHKNNIAHVDIDLYCKGGEKLKPVARDDIAPFVVCSFDIETNSSTGKFKTRLFLTMRALDRRVSAV